MTHILLIGCYIPYLYSLGTYFCKRNKSLIDLPYEAGMSFYLKIIPLYAIPLFFYLFKEKKDYQIIRYIHKRRIIVNFLISIILDAFLCSISFLLMNFLIFKHLRVSQSVLLFLLLMSLLLMQACFQTLLHDPLLIIMIYVVSSPLASDYMKYIKHPMLTDLFLPECLFTRYPHPPFIIPVCLLLLCFNTYLLKRKEYL